LNNQRSVLHQLYNLVITITETREELEIYWQTLSKKRKEKSFEYKGGMKDKNEGTRGELEEP
jgi:hypothetical protein